MALLLRKISYWSLFLICWGIQGQAVAQKKDKSSEIERSAAPAQTHRLEFESNSFDDEHWVHPLPDSTLLVISSKRNAWYAKSSFQLTRYDRQLKPIWQTSYEHKTGTGLHQVTADRNKIYLLYTTREPKKLLLYQVETKDGSALTSDHLLPSNNINIKDMKVLQGQIFLHTLEHIKLNMLLLDPTKEEVRLLPAVFGLEDDLGEFRVDTLSKAVEFVVAESNGWRTRLQTKRMNASGEVIGTYFLQPSMQLSRDDNTLLNARLTPGDTLQKLLIGTYGYRSSIFARGLFTSDLAGNIKYYDFSQLDHFFEFTTPRRQKRLKAKFAKQESKGKPLILRYRLLLHPVMPHPQGYAIVGEIYYPQYRSTGFVTASGNPNFGQGPEARRLFDGFRFTHAIVCVFDRQGNLLWDNSYKLTNETYPELAPTVEPGVSPKGKITLVSPKKELLRFKTMKPGVSMAHDDEVAVRTKEESEKLVNSEKEGIVQWYGNHFVSFGLQRIRPQQGPGRTVFYMQTLVFE